jgi:5'-3' exonuclease
LRVHLVDGTYELFRHYFAVPKKRNPAGVETAATVGVLGSVLGMIEGGTTHVAVATDHVIESFRNDMWPGYKSSAGIEKELLDQFWPLEDALRAMGVVVWVMTDVETDDALGAGAALAAKDPRVEQVLICTPDKDVAQCVDGTRVVQFDRRKRELRDEEGVIARFGVAPSSIPDYLGLVGDSSDGFPGLQGWGPKSAATLLARYGTIEDIPDTSREWDVALRGADGLAATLRANRDLALLFKDIATLRCDVPLFTSVDELRWTGPTAAFGQVASDLGAPELGERATRAAQGAERQT